MQEVDDVFFTMVVSTIIILFMSALFVFIIFRHLKYKADAKATLFKEIYLAQEKERSRIAMDLHDDLGSNLLCIKMKLDEIKYHKESLLDVNQELDELITLTSDAIVKNRATSHLLMPESLRRYGLESAFKDLFKHYERSFNFSFTCDLPKRLPFLIEINVYRIVSELLSNTAKHSKATEVKLLVRLDGSLLVLEYSDNGHGFDFETIQKTSTSIGLSNIKNRVSFLNGVLDFDKEKFVYCIQVPIN
jgi:two-component system, NarL family, sensor kinase